MSRRSSSSMRRFGRRRGFTLMEAIVSLSLLIVVLTISMSLLFSLRSFAERQQFTVAPRQTARRALNYVSYYLSGAADLIRPVAATSNFSPNALIMFYNTSDLDPLSVVQASYNNITGTETGNSILATPWRTDFGDVGTDLITICFPANPVNLNVTSIPSDKLDPNLFFDFTKGCPGGAGTNMAEFHAVAGSTAAPTPSPMMIMYDADGLWTYFRVDEVVSSNCAAVSPSNVINARMTTTPYFDPPSGRRQMGRAPVVVAGGLQFLSFRVNNKNLEQKIGLFDPANPNTGFSPIIENVEDLQISYIYNDGQVFNTSSQSLTAAGLPLGVPSQAGPCTGVTTGLCASTPQINCPCPVGARDVTNLSAVRLSVTGRSTQLPQVSLGLQQRENRYVTLDSEDHVINPTPTKATNQAFYEYNRMTTTILLRNRTLTE